MLRSSSAAHSQPVPSSPREGLACIAHHLVSHSCVGRRAAAAAAMAHQDCRQVPACAMAPLPDRRQHSAEAWRATLCVRRPLMALLETSMGQRGPPASSSTSSSTRRRSRQCGSGLAAPGQQRVWEHWVPPAAQHPGLHLHAERSHHHAQLPPLVAGFMRASTPRWTMW